MEIKSKLLGPALEILRAWAPQPPINMVPLTLRRHSAKATASKLCDPGQVG